MEEGTEKYRLYHCPEWYEIKKEIPALSESRWNRCHSRMEKWVSEKHKSWGMPAEGFKGHVATDGSLLGSEEKW